MLEFMIIGLAA